MIKRSYEVTINMQAGNPIKLTGKTAENFWVMWQNYKRGNDIPAGFDISTPTTDGKSFTVQSILFKNVVSVDRSAITATEVDAVVPEPIKDCSPDPNPIYDIQTFKTEAERQEYLKSKGTVEDLPPKPDGDDQKTDTGDKGTEENGAD